MAARLSKLPSCEIALQQSQRQQHTEEDSSSDDDDDKTEVGPACWPLNKIRYY